MRLGSWSFASPQYRQSASLPAERPCTALPHRNPWDSAHAAWVSFGKQRWVSFPERRRSARNLADRVALLQAPFDEIYGLEYPWLSWYAHSSGLTGFVNLQPRTLNQLAGYQNKLAGENYVSVLTLVIDEFGLEKANTKIKTQLKMAKIMPFSTTPEEKLEQERIERELAS